MRNPANEDEESRLSTNGFSYQDLLQIVDLIKTSEQFNEFHLKVGDIELDIRRGGAPCASTPFPCSGNPGGTGTAGRRPAPPVPLPPRRRPRRQLLLPLPLRNPIAPRPLAYPAGSVLVKSPMVGTFYRAPEPGAHPFVEVGARVTAESIVGIVEVMKLMNSIPAGQAGVVTHVLVNDGEPVEYGQVLLVIDGAAA
jgi:acetyl-CoA carboxylase biotin carboxyl carrier protein